MVEGTIGRRNEGTKELLNEWLDGWMDEWMLSEAACPDTSGKSLSCGKWMIGCMDGWMDD
jgi:hypothetical protein